MYTFLFTSFLLFFLYDLIRRKESTRVALFMGVTLFLVVALRAYSVGPDTSNYVSLYFTGVYGNDMRDMEAVFLGWNALWRNLYLGGQMYLVVCAVASVGLVLYSIWKTSRQRVWSYALFLTVYSWYFYLSGIRQGIAMGCFTMGVCLLNREIDCIFSGDIRNVEGKKRGKSFSRRLWDDIVITFRRLFNRNTIFAWVFLFLAPMFHTTAFYALGMLLIVLFFRGNRTFYIIAIAVSFIAVVTGVFQQAEQLLERAFMLVAGDLDISSRYEVYLDDDYIYDTSLYLVLKECLPVTFIALLILLYRKREFRMTERLFFWFVIMHNLFFYFSYMFRLNMYLHPFACIAIANLMFPVLKKKKFGIVHVLVIMYMLLSAYVGYKNLMQQPEFIYHFCF